MLHLGLFDGVATDNYILEDYTVNINGTNQTSYASPALAYNANGDSYLRLAWTGTDGRINIVRTYDGQNWGAQNTWWNGPRATGGLGLTWGGTSIYSWSLYFSWIGNQSPWALHLGNFTVATATFSDDFDFPNYSQQRWDASLSEFGGTFYIPYSGEWADLNVLYTTASDPSGWTNNNTQWSSALGASMTYNNNDGSLYIVWREAALYNNEMDLSSYP